MNARNAAQRIVAILLIATGACGSTVFANPVHIYSADFDLPIPSPDAPDSEFGRGWMADAVIDVPDHFTVDDIDVGITLTHTNMFDLQIFLQSPDGTTLCLNQYGIYEYLEGANYTQTIFSDEAELPIEQADPPFTGEFRPKTPNLLEAFDGLDSFGLWRLRIYDAWYYDTGTLNHFELIITTPEPATAILLILGMALMRLHKHRGNLKNV
jgi:subtilisin-like proprotein convertase family protein